MPTKKIRFAVVGLGHIAQIAVLPAFEHARQECQLTALISDDSEKLNKLSSKYRIKNCWSYKDYDQALRSDQFDAVYIALPNDLHAEYACRAMRAGIHVLCEKPMAVSVAECEKMIDCARENAVKLMIAYRLHFEKTNMQAVEVIESGEIGEPRIYNASFALQIREGNIRTKAEHGGGPLFDIGIYCINAARYLFKTEPVEVTALMVKSNDERFKEIEEATGALLKFPDAKLASFVCSFGAANFGRFDVLGTKGSLTLDPAFEYADRLRMCVKVNGKKKETSTAKGDQFAPELLHFARCIKENKEPNPSGQEGLNDLKVIEAIRESARTGSTIELEPLAQPQRPSAQLIEEKPRVIPPRLIKVASASK